MNLNEEVEGDLFIVDTDGGADDAMAIALALIKCPSRVLAFTCCHGNTTLDNVLKNVMRVMVVCGIKDIPIYRGSSGPLIARNDVDMLHGSDGFGNCGHEFPTEDLCTENEPASFALTNLTKKYPGRITLIALAPLTNLALTHRIDPEFTKRLKDIVCLGGNYKGIGNITETAEFNFYCDPEAARIVLTESLCPVILIPWETTMKYGIEWDEFQSLVCKQNKMAQFLKRISSVIVDYCHNVESSNFEDCDFQAVVVALYPKSSIKSTVKRAMSVECRGEFSTGLCILKMPSLVPKHKKLIEIVEDFDSILLRKLREELYDGKI